MITAQGIGSGLDVASIVSQLVAAEGQPGLIRLGTREASIQSQLSALGSLKSALATFRDAVTPLTSSDTFRIRSATSADESIFGVAASPVAVPGSYDVEVLQLAQVQKLTTTPFASLDAELGPGDLIISYGEGAEDRFAVSLAEPPPPENPEDPQEVITLADVRDAINAAPDNPGVTASLITADDGVRLVLTGKDTGSEAGLRIESSGGDGSLAVFEYGGTVVNPDMQELQRPQDAIIEVNGFQVTKNTNRIEGAVEGVTIDLVSAAPGTVVEMRVETDLAAISAKVSAFVEGYNALVAELDGLNSYDADSGISSPLFADSTLRTVASRLRREVGGAGFVTSSDINTLADIGITTTLEGKLELDSSVLNTAVNDDLNAVDALLGGENGYASRLDAVLNPFLETGGTLDTRTEGLEKDIELIADQRTALNRRLASVEARYLRQFSALDSIISSLSNTSNFLASQLAILPRLGDN